jgi:hypothetical protein
LVWPNGADFYPATLHDWPLVQGNYSAKKMEKVLDTVFLNFFTLSRHRTLVTRHIFAGALKLAERV